MIVKYLNAGKVNVVFEMETSVALVAKKWLIVVSGNNRVWNQINCYNEPH